ncbi:MAG: sensor histidine kinase KdpD [Myxococcota bacterium]
MHRPTPEEMLVRAAEEEAKRGKGHLKVFFGAAPGVGKTYAMLEAGQRQRAVGVDVVLGWVETHGRAETEALTVGFERIPPRRVEHGPIALAEFDLEAALARRPALILVDELPHTNAPGSTHTRRWQDVEELLAAGIDVHTTLNVQHLESLNDVVAQITGVRVRETVPDALIDAAEVVEMVDLTPDDLIARLEQGKVYVGDRADRALDGFFRRGNLVALRELALRRAAERADADVLSFRRDAGIEEPWPAGERLLVAVGPAPQGADLIRAAARIAGRLHAPWIAASVEGSSQTDTARAQVAAHLTLAERLGAEAVVLRSERAVDELLAYARTRNVTRILVGRPTHSVWRDRLSGSFLDALVRSAQGIDVIVTTGEVAPPHRPPAAPLDRPTAREVAQVLLIVGVASAVGLVTRDLFDLADQAMIHLLAVVVAASRVGRAASMVAVLAAVAALDFLFVPPFYTFAVSDGRYLLSFAVMGIVGLTVSHLTHRVRSQADAALERERRTAALHAMSRELAGLNAPSEIAHSAVRHLRVLLDADVSLVRAEDGALEPLAGEALGPRDLAVVQWVVGHGQPAGAGTDTLPGGRRLFVPLRAGSGVVGALGLDLGDRPSPGRRALVEVAAATIALALERAWLAESSETARLVLETERTRTSLLSAVSHDLRTPLASITGAAGAALTGTDLTAEERDELLSTIRDEGQRLGRLIQGLLDLTLLAADPAAKMEWVPIDEIVASAVDRLDAPNVSVRLPEPLLMVQMDPVLVDQLLFNLLENATKHAPGSEIEVSAHAAGDEVVVEVADRGPGLPPGAAALVFERFWRAPDGHRTEGAGLGLAIAAAIARAHGGRVHARTRDGGGSVFGFSLPVRHE